jgi:hypothetical protein
MGEADREWVGLGAKAGSVFSQQPVQLGLQIRAIAAVNLASDCPHLCSHRPLLSVVAGGIEEVEKRESQCHHFPAEKGPASLSPSFLSFFLRRKDGRGLDDSVGSRRLRDFAEGRGLAVSQEVDWENPESVR